ncbi:hypothetical protein DHEL01_v203288 [Diaporthe helianthi]|uniref:LYR family protein n=1 Tax=Diaporthe helianthi TaxID=158607 RepID=A0A2P5I789_DIAHE|nr:hypothetical protein DHEL01_v203288 [Diaporthe helianthi]
MAPGYRTTATNTRRGNRSGLAEHDDFEGAAYKTPETQADKPLPGLPVRQWRHQLVNVAPPPEREEAKKQDRWGVELPHGMPRDTHLLTPHNQELLRLVRSGKLYKKRPLPEEEDADGDGMPGDKSDKKDSAAGEGYGFKVKKWVRLERSAEDSGINLLAPRHKNTITRPSKQLGTQATAPMVTKATVKRLDAAGNPYTQEVIVSDGQAVDGEIISTSVMPAPGAAGEAVLPAATPAKRKPPIPQKKKGRGRGRGGRGRGRLPLATPIRPVPQQDGSTEVNPETVGPDGVKIEPEDASRVSGDLETNESSALDDDDGDEGSGDDDEGDGDESATPAAEGEDQEMRDAPAYPPSDSIAEVPVPPATTSSSAEAAAHPGANLAPPPLVTDSVQLEGSPLKNVTTRSPTDPSPHLSPIAATATATATASAGAVLSGVPGEYALGLEPSVPESQQAGLRSQAFFRGDSIDQTPAEPPAPAPGPSEIAPAEDFKMEDVTSMNIESQETRPEAILDQSIVPSSEAMSAPHIVGPPPASEAVPVAQTPALVEEATAVGAAPVVEPAAAADPPAVVEPRSHVEELPAAPPKEDVPLSTSEQAMPGQAAGTLNQQVPTPTEPAPTPAPSPPPVAQAPAEDAKELIQDVGSSGVKTEYGGAEKVRVEGEGVADMVADMVAETTGAQGAEANDTVVPDDAQVGEVKAEDVGTEDLGTEDVVTEDGSFDILGSLSTSLNQQAEDDLPAPSLPPGPTDKVIFESVLPARSNEAAPAIQPDETGAGGLAAEAMGMDSTDQTGNIGETSEETVKVERSSDVKTEGSGVQTHDLPERPGEEK